ncbi:MAG TPA: acetylxylan esterase, partial [Gammaproteobacteria bacterium]|nr:acetylxylan esterase [Gammaproteobacteria bacterium]
MPGALTFTEEWGVLGLVAPRALMVINATRDGIQFSVVEAKKSLAGAEVVFAKVGKPKNVTHVIVDSNHDYNQPMREAMYGWVTLHLKNEGDGSPIPEPDISPVDRNLLRCYPEGHRPEGFVTLPMLAKRFAVQLNRRQVKPVHLEHWEADRVA